MRTIQRNAVLAVTGVIRSSIPGKKIYHVLSFETLKQ